jgi:flagellar biosynthesis protein FlhF
MRIERFEGRTMSEAVAKVRRKLGPDAILLHTGVARRGGMLGLFGRKVVEIIATRDARAIVRGPLASPAPSRRPDAEHRQLEQRLGRMQKALDNLLKQRDRTASTRELAPALGEIYQQLVNGDVTAELADALMRRLEDDLSSEQLKDPTAVRERLRTYIARLIGSGSPIALRDGELTRIAMVGPTGTGKTTTVAKIAAHFRLRESKRVALITCDTYRIAAVEQLQRYAQLLGVPCRAVHTPADVRRAVADFGEFDLLIMDTMGRSHRHDRHINELREFVDALQPHETHLLLSMTGRTRNLAAVVQSFDRLAISRVIFSKADESGAFGLILSIVAGMGKGVSYITTGQEVPDDIEVGRPSRIARLILGEEAA